MTALRAVYGTALAAWAGIAVYVSALLLPGLAARVPDAFPSITRVTFASYFRTGEALAAVAAAAALLEWLWAHRRGGAGPALVRLLLAAAVLMLLVYAGEVLLPQVRTARGDEARFAALHARSLLCNGLSALGALLGALGSSVAPPASGPRYRP